jgi:hypothetical protein
MLQLERRTCLVGIGLRRRVAKVSKSQRKAISDPKKATSGILGVAFSLAAFPGSPSSPRGQTGASQRGRYLLAGPPMQSWG